MLSRIYFCTCFTYDFEHDFVKCDNAAIKRCPAQKKKKYHFYPDIVILLVKLGLVVLELLLKKIQCYDVTCKPLVPEKLRKRSLNLSCIIILKDKKCSYNIDSKCSNLQITFTSALEVSSWVGEAKYCGASRCNHVSLGATSQCCKTVSHWVS